MTMKAKMMNFGSILSRVEASYGVFHIDRHIEVALQARWTFRGAAEKLDDDTGAKTRRHCSLPPTLLSMIPAQGLFSVS